MDDLHRNATHAPSSDRRGPHHFVSQDDLELQDIVCAGITAVLFLGYLLIYIRFNRTHPYSSMSSHVELQRVQWTKHVFSASRHRMNVIQCFRSCLMIISFYISCCLTAAAAISRPIFSSWETPAMVRSAVPVFLLFAALVNFFIVGMSHYYLHFHTQVEEGAGSPDLSRGRSEKYAKVLGRARVKQHTQREMDELTMKVTKQRSAAMILQAEWHFRYGWRLLTMGLTTTLWATSPYAMLAASVLLVCNLYYSDFPFPASVEKRMHTLIARCKREQGEWSEESASSHPNSPSGQHNAACASVSSLPSAVGSLASAAASAAAASAAAADASTAPSKTFLLTGHTMSGYGALEHSSRFVAVEVRRSLSPTGDAYVAPTAANESEVVVPHRGL